MKPYMRAIRVRAAGGLEPPQFTSQSLRSTRKFRRYCPNRGTDPQLLHADVVADDDLAPLPDVTLDTRAKFFRGRGRRHHAGFLGPFFHFGQRQRPAKSLLSLSTIARGVIGGRGSPSHDSTLMPGIVSAMVGTPGGSG